MELDRVAALLSEVERTPVRIVGVDSLGGEWAPVHRLRLDATYPHLGSAVVVKSRRVGGNGWGYHPENLRREHRALCEVSVAATVLAFDDSAGLLVLSDLGSGPSVENLLMGHDPVAARDGLVALARAVGKMHASTRQARAAITDGTWLDTPLAGWSSLVAACVELGFPVPTAVSDDLSTIDARLREPGVFAGLVHGDLGPHNSVQRDDGVWLVDFEGAGYRHIGLDAACLRFPFPQYGHWATVPCEVIDAMEHAYREQLGGWADDDRFASMMALGTATVAIARTYRLRVIADPDQPVELALRRRSQIVHTLEVFIDSTGRAGTLPALNRWAADLVDAMRNRWSEATVAPRRFPAFTARADKSG